MLAYVCSHVPFLHIGTVPKNEVGPLVKPSLVPCYPSRLGSLYEATIPKLVPVTSPLRALRLQISSKCSVLLVALAASAGIIKWAEAVIFPGSNREAGRKIGGEQ